MNATTVVGALLATVMLFLLLFMRPTIMEHSAAANAKDALHQLRQRHAALTSQLATANATALNRRNRFEATLHDELNSFAALQERYERIVRELLRDAATVDELSRDEAFLDALVAHWIVLRRELHWRTLA